MWRMQRIKVSNACLTPKGVRLMACLEGLLTDKNRILKKLPRQRVNDIVGIYRSVSVNGISEVNSKRNGAYYDTSRNTGICIYAGF